MVQKPLGLGHTHTISLEQRWFSVKQQNPFKRKYYCTGIILLTVRW